MGKLQKQKKQKAGTVTVTNDRIKTFPFFIVGLLFIIVSLYLSFYPEVNRGWGLNYIKYFAPYVIVLYYMILLCFWLPPTNKQLINIISRINKQSVVSFLQRYKYPIFILISILSGYIFYLLTIKYIFLGDLDIRAKQIEEGHIINDEYLTMLFFKHIHAFLKESFNFTGVQTIRLFDYITGGIYIFISLCIADLLGNTILRKIAVFFVGTLSCTILLQFCGYTEIYAFPILFLLLYLFACLLHLKEKVSVFIPLIVLLVGLGVHLLIVCMLPSYLFLFYRDKLWKHPFFRKRSTFILLILIATPFVIIAFNKFALPMMLPFSPGENKLMTMFSVEHYKEFINSQLLASGIGFFIWITTIIYAIVKRIKIDVIQWFFCISSVSIVGLMFVFDGLRGSGDWDIYSFAAIVYNLANASFLLMLHDKRICNNIKYGILMISGFSVLHTSMWIITNKTDISIAWVENAFENDPASYYKTSFNNDAMIASMFGANQLIDKSLYWNKKAYQKHRDDPRMGYNYANKLFEYGHQKEAIVILEELTRNFPLYALPYPLLVNEYITTENYAQLYDLLVRMERAYNANPEAFTSRLPKEQLDSFFELLNRMRIP